MKYAIIALGGKQLKVKEGLTFKIERQNDLNIDVLMYSDGKELLVGEPTLDQIEVKATVTSEDRAKKVVVARFKSKSRYRKRSGHRQPMSTISIDSIQLKGAKTEKAPKVEKEAKVEKTEKVTKKAPKSKQVKKESK